MAASITVLVFIVSAFDANGEDVAALPRPVRPAREAGGQQPPGAAAGLDDAERSELGGLHEIIPRKVRKAIPADMPLLDEIAPSGAGASPAVLDAAARAQQFMAKGSSLVATHGTSRGRDARKLTHVGRRATPETEVADVSDAPDPLGAASEEKAKAKVEVSEAQGSAPAAEEVADTELDPNHVENYFEESDKQIDQLEESRAVVHNEWNPLQDAIKEAVEKSRDYREAKKQIPPMSRKVHDGILNLHRKLAKMVGKTKQRIMSNTAELSAIVDQGKLTNLAKDQGLLGHTDRQKAAADAADGGADKPAEAAAVPAEGDDEKKDEEKKDEEKSGDQSLMERNAEKKMMDEMVADKNGELRWRDFDEDASPGVSRAPVQ